MSYLIEGLEVFGGAIVFGCMMIGVMLVAAVVLAHLPAKRHRPPKRVLWHDCPDEVVRLVDVPYDQDIVKPFTSNAFEWAEWEVKFNSDPFDRRLK